MQKQLVPGAIAEEGQNMRNANGKWFYKRLGITKAKRSVARTVLRKATSKLPINRGKGLGIPHPMTNIYKSVL
jgi:hypothetical protein